MTHLLGKKLLFWALTLWCVIVDIRSNFRRGTGVSEYGYLQSSPNASRGQDVVNCFSFVCVSSLGALSA